MSINWKYGDGVVKRKLVEEVEKCLRVSLPEDYKECVIVNQGASPSHYIFDTVEGEERVFGALLKINNYNSDTNIIEIYEDYKDTLPNELIAFGIDPAGNLICFDYKDHNSNPIVVFWEHENAGEKVLLMQENGISAEEAEEVARENVFFVANSFTEFLEKLHD